MPDTISLKDVLDFMDGGEPFSIVFITCDQKKEKAGELITVGNARKHNWMSPDERRKLEKLQPESQILKKNPRHYENSTRNIMILANREIRKIHIRLIRKFNGKTVL